MVLLAGDRGAAALQSLQQATDVGGGPYPHQQMQVRSHDPDLQDPSALLGRDAAEKSAEEPRQTGIDERCAKARGPDDVTIDAVDHVL